MSEREDEAKALAVTIRDYWHVRGESPLVWVDRQLASSSAKETRFIYLVRSDMLGGWPRAYSVAALPRASLKIVTGTKSESASAFAVLTAMGQRLTRIESQRPSNRIWRDVGTGT